MQLSILGMAQAVEQILVQAIVAHLTIEAFHEPVLHRFARGNGCQHRRGSLGKEPRCPEWGPD